LQFSVVWTRRFDVELLADFFDISVVYS